MAKNDGGPAFPTVPLNHGYAHDSHARGTGSQIGMTLRDYFAAAAMTEVIRAKSAQAEQVVSQITKLGSKLTDSDVEEFTRSVSEVVAAGCYAIADAMLAERAK